MLCHLLYKYALVKTDPKQAHKTAMRLVGAFGRSPLAQLSSATVRHLDGDRLRGSLACPVSGRFGLTAGQDKNATAVLGTVVMGFTFTEVGMVASSPQPGSNRPRLWCLPEKHAFRNRVDFSNDGADAVAEWFVMLRLTRRGRACVVGVNIGKNKQVEAADVPANYAVCARKLTPYAGYLVINVSSPNTLGLRDLRTAKSLRPIMRVTHETTDLAVDRRVSILTKTAPDLGDADVDGVADLVAEEEMDGIVVTNTTAAHSYGEGGLSGEPVRARTLEVISRLGKGLGPGYIAIGVEGILTVSDAETMVSASADLLEALTGFAYEGPLTPGRINRALARKQPSARSASSRKQTSSREWSGRSDCQ